MEKRRIKKVTFWQSGGCYVVEEHYAEEVLRKYEQLLSVGYPLLKIYHEQGQDWLVVNAITSVDVEYAEDLPEETEELFDKLKGELEK